jgi:hypothetical protein
LGEAGMRTEVEGSFGDIQAEISDGGVHKCEG